MDPAEREAFRTAVDSGEPVDHGLSMNGDAPDEAPPTDYRFMPLAEFAAVQFPSVNPLIGKPGMSYLAERMLLLAYGGDGAGKSTWTIDAVAHLATGRDWLGIPVPRPVRCVVIEVEGPAGLFQAKLAHKLETWDGEDFTPNVHLYGSPWGDFTFADPHGRRALAAYCDEHEIELVMANPTLGLGVAATGRPDETQQFVDWLKECGLYTGRAFWLLHHENKAGQISGDWGRHPDTKVQLQRDGNQQRTKLTWEKTRWATLEPDERSVLLDWELDTQGYTVRSLDTIGASDEELLETLKAYLAEHPVTAQTHVLKNVSGTDGRIIELLHNRPEFDFVEGPKNAKLWKLAECSAEGS
jgi:hypothetical protein